MKQRPGKEELLKEYYQGGTSVRRLAEKYGMSKSAVQNRLMAAKKVKSKKALSQAEKLPKPGKEMPTDVKQLQEALHNAQLHISLLEAVIDISDEQYGTDIRKKSGTRQS